MCVKHAYLRQAVGPIRMTPSLLVGVVVVVVEGLPLRLFLWLLVVLVVVEIVDIVSILEDVSIVSSVVSVAYVFNVFFLLLSVVLLTLLLDGIAVDVAVVAFGGAVAVVVDAALLLVLAVATFPPPPSAAAAAASVEDAQPMLWNKNESCRQTSEVALLVCIYVVVSFNEVSTNTGNRKYRY